MNTPSHFLMTAALRKVLPKWEIPRWPFWLGAISPDLPLYALSLGAFVYFPLVKGSTAGEAAEHMYGTLFYQDPYWMALHNVLHSPMVLVPAIFVAAWYGKRGVGAGTWLSWFFSACLYHAVVDIFTHNDDGPLYLWPVSWTARFSSPVSYWDPDHFGRAFSVFELGLDVGLSVFLVLAWRRSRSRLSDVVLDSAE